MRYGNCQKCGKTAFTGMYEEKLMCAKCIAKVTNEDEQVINIFLRAENNPPIIDKGDK